MTEPQQPAAPLEVADPEPALPEPEATIESPAPDDAEAPVAPGTDCSVGWSNPAPSGTAVMPSSVARCGSGAGPA